jgi:hypothetical protein
MPMLVALALLLMLVLAAPAADAQRVHRCRTADGIALYADRPCDVMNSVPMDAAASEASIATPAPSIPPDSGRDIPFAAEGCPAVDPPALQLAVERALAARDLNALAGLYAWDGAGRTHANHVLGVLQALINSRPGQIRLLEADGWTWAPTAAPEPALPRLHVYRDATDTHPQGSFRVVRGSGCVWLGS